MLGDFWEGEGREKGRKRDGKGKEGKGRGEI